MLNRRVLLSAMSAVLLAASLLTLRSLNMIVHEDLYGYGLAFSEEWAVPYWNLLHVTAALIVCSAVLPLLPHLWKSTRKKSLSRLENLQPATKKYFHILYFDYVDDAEDFKAMLRSRLPSVPVRLQTIGNRASLSFRLDESIEDLDSFSRVVDYKIKEEVS